MCCGNWQTVELCRGVVANRDNRLGFVVGGIDVNRDNMGKGKHRKVLGNKIDLIFQMSVKGQLFSRDII